MNSSFDKYFQFIFLKMSLFCLHFFLYFSMYVCESHSVISNSLRLHGLQSPWNSPGQNTGVGSLSFLQRIFLTQELNQSLLHCRQILYHLSYQGRIQYQQFFYISSLKLEFQCLLPFIILDEIRAQFQCSSFDRNIFLFL